jgi:hypothetical protein
VKNSTFLTVYDDPKMTEWCTAIQWGMLRKSPHFIEMEMLRKSPHCIAVDGESNDESMGEKRIHSR